jgi:hypothetical protein
MAIAPNEIMLKNVRLSYPSVFQTEVYNGEDTGKYAATFILDPKEHQALFDAAMDKINALIKESKITVKKDKICLREDDHGEGWTVKATNKTRPLVVNTDRSPLTEDDNVIYGGCYVNAKIGFWVQNNAYGKRVNANLLGMQFAKDGKPFGEKKVASADDFDAIEPADSFVAELAEDDAPF